jgi:hypothetical protein
MEDVLGWVLVVLGVLFLIVGLIEAFRKVLTASAARAGGIDWGALIGALIKAGLLYIAVGLGLLLLGLDILDIYEITSGGGS